MGVAGLCWLLLIEPVWNRNHVEDWGLQEWIDLLIEPVWNRNGQYRCYDDLGTWLLIEPVWNRNLCVPLIEITGTVAFNRTSLESKRKRVNSRAKPQFSFNRTSLESKPLQRSGAPGTFSTFNRTSLESKPTIDKDKSSVKSIPFNRTSLESKHTRRNEVSRSSSNF